MAGTHAGHGSQFVEIDFSIEAGLHMTDRAPYGCRMNSGSGGPDACTATFHFHVRLLRGGNHGREWTRGSRAMKYLSDAHAFHVVRHGCGEAFVNANTPGFVRRSIVFTGRKITLSGVDQGGGCLCAHVAQCATGVFCVGFLVAGTRSRLDGESATLREPASMLSRTLSQPGKGLGFGAACIGDRQPGPRPEGPMPMNREARNRRRYRLYVLTVDEPQTTA